MCYIFFPPNDATFMYEVEVTSYISVYIDTADEGYGKKTNMFGIKKKLINKSNVFVHIFLFYFKIIYA